MTKYLSKEGLNLYDSLIKDYFDDKVLDVLDLVAYGVEWDINVADPHLTRIGNLSFHKTLPIQSGMKPCIAQSDKIMYWLNESDRRFRKDTTGYIVTLPLTIDSGVYKLVDLNNFTNKRYYKQYVKVNNLIAQVKDIDTTTYTATLNFIDSPDTLEAGDCTVEFGAVLNGYDGTVEVFVPAFYIKSFIEGTKRRVYISTIKIDDTWVYLKKCLLGAFRCTVLNTVPEDMGYLSTLPVNSAISVANTETYCRGGLNRPEFDQYLETDPFRTDLGKPRTGISRKNMRTYARNAGKEILNYTQYKNICYWLYVIEYANFNCFEKFSLELTTEGYRLGGLGIAYGINSGTDWNNYNKQCPIIPNDATLDLENITDIKTVDIKVDDTKIYNIVLNTYRGIHIFFGDIYTHLEGCLVTTKKNEPFTSLYIINNKNNYTDTIDNISIIDQLGYWINGLGAIKEFDLQENANITPSLIGAANTTYKCGRTMSGDGFGETIRTVFVGGVSYSGTLCTISSQYAIYTPLTETQISGFRLIKELD